MVCIVNPRFKRKCVLTAIESISRQSILRSPLKYTGSHYLLVCSIKQWLPLIELELTTNQLRVKYSTHCVLPKSVICNEISQISVVLFYVQEMKGSLGVRMALGETQIVQETRDFLTGNGVALDSFSQVRADTLSVYKSFQFDCNWD